MQYLPPPSLQTAEYAEQAVRREANLPPQTILNVAEDNRIPGAFVVSADSAEATGVWWYGVDARVIEIPENGRDLEPRVRLIEALDRIERAVGTNDLPVVITPDLRIQGAFYVSVEDEDTIDHWVSPQNDVVVNARINAVSTPELIEAQAKALTPTQTKPEIDNIDIPGIAFS